MDIIEQHPETTGPATASPPAQRRSRAWLLIAATAVVALVVGLLAGLGIGRASVHPDPTASAQYKQLQQRFATDEQQIGNLQTDIGDAQSSARAASQAAAQSAATLSQQAAAVASQQAALDAQKQAVAASSIGQGVWTVGVNVAPGTYRTAAAVIGQCYWKITKTGSSSDIVDNDIVSGGFPTVRLSAGEDFLNEGCGTFVKQ